VRALPEEAGYYERIRLGELVAGEMARLREMDAQLALGRLGPLAVEWRQEEASESQTAYKFAFLVDRDREESFTAAVNQLIAAQGDQITVRYVGPLPPYSFAETDLMASGERWS